SPTPREPLASRGAPRYLRSSSRTTSSNTLLIKNPTSAYGQISHQLSISATPNLALTFSQVCPDRPQLTSRGCLSATLNSRSPTIDPNSRGTVESPDSSRIMVQKTAVTDPREVFRSYSRSQITSLFSLAHRSITTK